MLVLDLSKSMEETDLPRNRLDAAQRVVRNFVKKRESDRVGLVVFANGVMLQCPLTSDMKALDQIVADLAIGDVPDQGTAIGDGLALGLAQLRRAKSKSRIVILLSDGDNNVSRHYAPRQAADLAAEMKVKVFTVLVGAEGGLFGGSDVDPETLRSIARRTGGEFFRAGDADELERSFQQGAVDPREAEADQARSASSTRTSTRRWSSLGLGLLGLELVLVGGRFRRLP